MPKLTIRRSSATDPIYIELHVFNPETKSGAETTALFDTGNDHTVISKELLESVGGTVNGRQMQISGVTGSLMAQAATVTFGLIFDETKKVTINNHEVVVQNDAPNHVLIGRDFLERFDITSSRDGTFTMQC